MADYTNKRGIFSLLDVRERQNAGNWSTRGDAWLSPSPFLVKNLVGFGYIGAGTNPPHYSSVERIDYSNDTATASVRGPLSAATYLLTATGNTSFGYYAGGYNHGSRVDRIDYSNDNATASPKGPLSTNSRYSAASTGNKDFGYFGGGSSVVSSVDRVDYSNDTNGISKRTIECCC